MGEADKVFPRGVPSVTYTCIVCSKISRPAAVHLIEAVLSQWSGCSGKCKVELAGTLA